MLDPDITGHRITDAWLNAHPPQNAPTLHTEPPSSACGRHRLGYPDIPTLTAHSEQPQVHSTPELSTPELFGRS